MENPKLLSENWKDCYNMILERLYTDIGQEIPNWLKTYVKSRTLDDFDDDQRETIRMFILEKINQQKDTIKVYDENGYRKTRESLSSDEIQTNYDFEKRVWHVINERLISWVYLVNIKQKSYVCLTQGLRNDLDVNTLVCKDLKSIAGLFRWKTGSV
ncbi:hypothetical protein ALNOE001_06510 [Candidatus Methanobinarius endosymbioticus]|uniref:Uncharacterized protein n=1 Tax=Candidatus Methanobinarius endosymbioticus TaxID=2006182 RepID=A0A366MEE2_9EURY|nr:hypothetical protein ALNOE001_06510 [Candidatus Methanobinarius endosymbioticus]